MHKSKQDIVNEQLEVNINISSELHLNIVKYINKKYRYTTVMINDNSKIAAIVGLVVSVVSALLWHRTALNSVEKLSRDSDYESGSSLAKTGLNEFSFENLVLTGEGQILPQQTSLHQHKHVSKLTSFIQSTDKQTILSIQETTAMKQETVTGEAFKTSVKATRVLLSEQPSEIKHIRPTKSGLYVSEESSVKLNQGKYYLSEQTTGSSVQDELHSQHGDRFQTKNVLVTESITIETPSKGNVCYKNVLQHGQKTCRPVCDDGMFSLPGMSSCLPWLQCEDFLNVKSGELIGEGATKKVLLGRWNNYNVAILTLKDNKYLEDFTNGLRLLKAFSGNDSVVQLLGFCEKTNSYITEHHPLGNVLNFISLLQTHDELPKYDSVYLRSSFCHDYVKILTFLHFSPLGTRVMCDSAHLGKLLHQLLVTNDLHLILSDLDALPQTSTANKIQCGHQQLEGDLVAPEQEWPYAELEFSEEKQPLYDEKTDIWKIPDVCGYFLGSDSQTDVAKYNFFNIHKKCKSNDPKLRPTAKEVLDVYKTFLQKILTN